MIKVAGKMEELAADRDPAPGTAQALDPVGQSSARHSPGSVAEHQKEREGGASSQDHQGRG